MEPPAKEVLDAANSSIVVTDPERPDNPIVYVNPAFERSTGYSFSEAVGRNCRFLQNSDRDQPALKDMREALDEGGEWSGILRNYRKNGELFWNELSISALSDQEGRTTHFIGVQRDVSERVEAERLRRESEQSVRSMLLRFGSDVIIILDSEGNVTYESPAVEEILGYEPGNRIGKHGLETIHPDDREPLRNGFSTIVESGGSTPLAEYRIRHANGTWRYFEGVINNMLDEPGIQGMVVASRDITERKQAEQALQESEARFRTLTDAALEALCIISREGEILEINRSYTEIFGYEPKEIIGRAAWITIAPESQETVARHIASEYEEPYEAVGMRKDGTHIDLELRGRRSTYRGKEVRITALRDITERKQAERALMQSEERFRTLAEATFEGIVISEGGVIVETNSHGAKMVGYEASEIVGKSVFELIAPEHREVVRQSLLTGNQSPYEISIVRSDGTRVEVEVRGTESYYGDRPVRLSAIRDISERKSLERRLRHQALHDSLTGLPNRILFNDRLAKSLESAGRSGETVAIMFLDLDNFKEVNDSLGHSAGDRLLVSVAECLGCCLRSSDTVSRMGGDEFTILLDGVDGESETSRITQRIVDRFHSPFTLSDSGVEHEIYVTISVGVVLANPGTEGQTTVEELLNRADTALYQAKDRGKDDYLFFHPDTEEGLQRDTM